MLKYTGDRSRILLWIYSPSGNRYQFHPSVAEAQRGFLAFPLSEGNGRYTIEFYEGEGTLYSPVDKQEIDVALSYAHMPFLMSNYYVNFTSGCAIIRKGEELSAGNLTELEKISEIYNWFVESIEYDWNRAETVQSGYVPNLAELMRDRKGICFDYSSGMAAMLRSQGIPTKLEEGWAGSEYHAWISAYTRDVGWVNTWISFNGSSWTLMEPTIAARSNNEGKQSFRDFVNNKSNYTTLFIY